MPTLYVLGSANGVGKTTWYQTGIENIEVDPEIPFINIDTIVLRELGGYSPENIAAGEQLAGDEWKLSSGIGRISWSKVIYRNPPITSG